MAESDDPVAIPEWRLKALPEVLCPDCSYDLTLNPVPRCPECGYTLNDDDIRHGERRRSFLLLTRHTAVGRHAFASLLLVLLIPYFGIVVAAPPILSVFVLSVGRGKGTVPRLRRRVWLMSTFWLQMPWIVGALAYHAYDWVLWTFFYSSSLPSFHEWPMEARFVVAVVIFVGGFWAWRRSLEHLVRKTTLRNDDPVKRWRSGATRVALLSYGLGVLLSALPVMLWVMDTFWPGWA